jgi:hypothetical protein
MGTQKFRLSFWGLLFVVTGILLLLQQFDVFYIGWKKILYVGLILYGGISFINGFVHNEKGKIFFGTIGFFIGLYFLLRTLDFVSLHHHAFFPLVLIIIGCAFLFTSFTEPRSFLPLVPALLFGGTGALLLLSHYGYWDYYDVWYNAKKYWPVILILLGGSLLLRSKHS